MNRLEARSRATIQSSARQTRETKRRIPVWAWLIIGSLAFVVAVVLSPIFAVIFLVVLVTGVVSLAGNRPTWLRFRSRKAAAWVTTISAAGFLITAGITNAALVGGPDKRVVTVAATPSGLASPASPPPPSATPSSTPPPAETSVEVRSVIDGDTIDTSAGKVRLIGIDAPEAGSWGYDQATAELASFLAPGGVTLVAASGRDDVDQYGRKLRYVKLNGQDAGSHLISTGWVIARYDGRDGYGTHPLQTTYITLDEAAEMPAEPQPVPAEPEQLPPPVPAQPEPAPANPAPPEPEPAAPSTDPQFRTCGEATNNGYGNYRQGVDPEYDWYQDRDKDGVVCEF